MNYQKLLEEFIEETLVECPYANREDIREICMEAINIMKSNVDGTPEEFIEKMISEDIKILENMRKNYLLPGYTIGINVSNINIKYFGGSIDSLETPMQEDTLFDIASMTKMYTQVIMYNLIKEGYLSMDSKIGDVDKRFVNLHDVTIREIMNFSVGFETERIDQKETKEEALKALYTASIKKDKDNNLVRGTYNYNDIGMMIFKEISEHITNKGYEDLLKEYVLDKLNVTNTLLKIPTSKQVSITGSANQEIGHVNDPKANAVGGYSGHAGIFASSDDLISFAKGLEDGTLLDKEGLKGAYTPNELKFNRGSLFGNTYVQTKDGLESSYVETFSPSEEFSIQGSTRAHLNIGPKANSTILLNPASISIEQALEEQNKINEQRAQNGRGPISLVRHFEYNSEGVLVPYHVIDATQVLNYRLVDPLTTMNAKTILRLRFLNKAIEAYEPTYKKEINVVRDVNKAR